jgi:hypothetical protein
MDYRIGRLSPVTTWHSVFIKDRFALERLVQ